MSILLDRLPNYVLVSGTQVPIHTDFRVWILFEQLCLDQSISKQERAQKAFLLLFENINTIPLDKTQQIGDDLLWFYQGGDREQNEYQIREQKKAVVRKKKQSESEPRYYDYDYDADYIYAAFMQQYGIDLSCRSLHWWKFRALLHGLTDDTQFMKILGYRSKKITKNMTADEKKFYLEKKQIYALPLPRDEREKAMEIESAVQSGDVSKIMQMVLGRG